MEESERRTRMAEKAFALSSFVLRHLAAWVASVMMPGVVVTVAYLVLLVVAVVTGSGGGSPIALPLWLLMVTAASIVYTTVVLFPSVLIAEDATRRMDKWRHLAQIPISTAALALLTWGVALLSRGYSGYADAAILHWADRPGQVVLALLIPLGLYWWTLKIVQAGVALPGWLRWRGKRPGRVGSSASARGGR